MITRSELQSHTPTPEPWQRELAQAYTRPGDLLRALGLEPHLCDQARAGMREFAFRVPRGFAARMRPGDPDDPLLRQVLPVPAESEQAPGYVNDPVGDLQRMPAPGVLHKYHGRALLVVTGACAIHCRYCFRRHFPYAEAGLSKRQVEQALAYLDANTSIREIILSGGDPLSVTDARLKWLLQQLATIPHLHRLRLHSRSAVTLPERITPELLTLLKRWRGPVVLVVHINHPNEIDHNVARAMAKLRAAGVMLLNQAVLLRGVNDSSGVLAQLSEKLADCAIQPYYLHLLDPVSGAAHFDVPQARARKIMLELQQRLPGYLLPALARETPGEAAKTRINP